MKDRRHGSRAWGRLPDMWIRRPGALTLAVLLLLASLVSSAGHDHALGVERTGTECAIDHEGEHLSRPGPGAEGSDPHLRAAGERHQHHCPGCRHNGFRMVFGPPTPVVGIGPDAGGSPALASLPRASRSRTGHTVRGPPSI